MTPEEAKARLKEMLPKMVDNYGHKEISYLDYRDNIGDPDTAARLFAEFDKYRNIHNDFADELSKLRSIINDKTYVDNEIEKARKRS